jgi:hypothetical protein
MTRAAHETLIRRLVLRHCPSVRFITGTITGVERAADDASKLGAVNYRAGGEAAVKTLPADLVIGAIFRWCSARSCD